MRPSSSARRVAGTAVDAHARGEIGNLHEILFDEQQAVFLQLRNEAAIGLVGHGDQNVGTSDIRVEDRFIGKDELRAASPAARFRPEILGHGGVLALENGGGLSDDGGGENHTLAAETGNSNLGQSHEQAGAST